MPIRSWFGWPGLIAGVALVLSACTPAATPTPTAQPAATAAALPTAAPAAEGELPDINPADYSGNIIAAGSSTVYPLAERMAEVFREDGFAGTITIDSIGSGAGLERFCVAGETDIANASRAIKDSEVEACQAIGREPLEFRVGTDALAVVVSADNDFLTGVTLAELAQIFSSGAEQWSDVNPDWPAEDIQRFSPGTDSGTFDYFVEAVMAPANGDNEDAGKAAILEAPALQLSEDDNVLVQGVEGSPYAIGYFGYAYYQENAAKLKILTIDGITPNAESVEGGEYPLARPLFLYSDAKIMSDNPQVGAFIGYFLAYVNDEITDVGYFPASDETLAAAREVWLESLP